MAEGHGSGAGGLSRAAAEHARNPKRGGGGAHHRSDENTASPYHHLLGFELSCTRDIEGVHVLEFYLNLYKIPREEADGE